MQQWWIGLAAGAATAVGYIIRRWIEKRGRSEGLRRRLQALSLLQGMKREGVSMKDLERIEREAADAE